MPSKYYDANTTAAYVSFRKGLGESCMELSEQ